MTVLFLDLGAAYRELAVEIDAAVARVTSSGWYIGGEEVAQFERSFAAYCGAAHCVGVGNGLDALQLALRACGVGPGDEVIVASNSYIATLLAVSNVGGAPVLVEPDPATHNLDPAKIEAAITPRTKAILPTHLYGQPADLEQIRAVSKAHGLKLVDDAAQAHGARYKGVPIGGGTDVTCWSFYPSKNLGALGDGGAVTTNDPEIAARIRMLGNYGSSVRYVNEELGVNSRLDPLQAAVLSAKLPHLTEWNGRRRAIAHFYTEALADIDIILPHYPSWAEPAWHQYVIRSGDRDRLAEQLKEAGISTLIHYPIAPHRQAAYADLGLGEGSLPIAERLAKSVLSLPIGPHLAMDQAELVAEVVRGAVR